MSAVTSRTGVITLEGYNRLVAELEELRTTRRREVADALREAREDGGEPGENTAIAAALDAGAALERRIEELGGVLATSHIAEPPPPGEVGIGTEVTLRMAPGAKPVGLRVVGAIECDPSAGQISVESPVGRMLLGRQAGDLVDVETPGGTRTVEILAVGDDA
jgi:transcription elongation factor GreA